MIGGISVHFHPVPWSHLLCKQAASSQCVRHSPRPDRCVFVFQCDLDMICSRYYRSEPVWSLPNRRSNTRSFVSSAGRRPDAAEASKLQTDQRFRITADAYQCMLKSLRFLGSSNNLTSLGFFFWSHRNCSVFPNESLSHWGLRLGWGKHGGSWLSPFPWEALAKPHK